MNLSYVSVSLPTDGSNDVNRDMRGSVVLSPVFVYLFHLLPHKYIAQTCLEYL